MVATTDVAAGPSQLKHGALSLPETIGQSIANIAPTLTPALNISVVAGLAGIGSWLSYLIATVGLVLLYITPNGNEPLAFITIALGGIPYAAPNQISRAMLADAADEDRLTSGVDRTGLLYALVAATAKIGPALAVGITFIGLDQLVGFDPNSEHNTPLAIHGLEAFFILLPAVLFALATLCLIGYPLTRRRHDEIRKALEAGPQG